MQVDKNGSFQTIESADNLPEKVGGLPLQLQTILTNLMGSKNFKFREK